MNFITFFLYFLISSVIFKALEVGSIILYFQYKKRKYNNTLNELTKSGRLQVMTLDEAKEFINNAENFPTTGKKTWN